MEDNKHTRSDFVVLFMICQIFSNTVQSSELYRCPSHLTRNAYLKTFRNHCYLFVNTELTWEEAKQDCNNNGQGHHVVIPDSATQTFVEDSLDDLNWSRNGIWIGAYHQSEWKWVNGETWSWTNWDTAENQGHHTCFPLLGCEECGQIRLSDGLWHDYFCDSMWYKYTYICQYDMLPATTTTTTTSTTTTTTPTTTTTITTTPNLNTSSTLSTTVTHLSTTSSTTSTHLSTTSPTTATNQTTHFSASSTVSQSSTGTPSTTPTSISTTSNQQTNQSALSDDHDDKKLSGGAIAGIVTSLVFLGLIIGILFLLFVVRGRRRKEKEEPSVMFDNRTYSLEEGQNRGNENRNSNPYDEIAQHRPTVAINSEFAVNGDVTPKSANDVGKKCLDEYLTPQNHIDLPEKKTGTCSDSKLDDSDDDSMLDLEETKTSHYDDIDLTDSKVANSFLRFDENDLSKTPISYNNNLYDTAE